MLIELSLITTILHKMNFDIVKKYIFNYHNHIFICREEKKEKKLYTYFYYYYLCN